MDTSIMSQNSTVLTSWKDIARYMGKGVRTVQRWEMDFGLPVRRPQGSNKKAVLARPRDLDAWVALRCASRGTRHQEKGAVSQPQLSGVMALHAQIETARQLQQYNRLLTEEVKSQLTALREQMVQLKKRD